MVASCAPTGGIAQNAEPCSDSEISRQAPRSVTVSVCIPTFNRLHFLREAVDSVLSQTFADLELIVCDDTSSDGTEAYCELLRRADPRVRVQRHAHNVGMAANWQAGLNASCGRYYAKLDDDNRWMPDFLARTVDVLENDPECAFATTDEWFINAKGVRDPHASEAAAVRFGRSGLATGSQTDTPSLAARQAFGINATLFRRQAVLDVGGYLREAGHAADTALFLHLAARGWRVWYIAERLEEYRLHDVRSSNTTVTDMLKADEAVWTWRSVRFAGEAERLRMAMLAEVTLNRSRVLSVHGRIAEARRAALQAILLQPLRPKALVALTVLCLPGPVRRKLIADRYSRG